MHDEGEYISALIELHRSLTRQGPGDRFFSESMLERMPPLPPAPRIADLGCGAGAGALLLAERFRSTVKAVDMARVFLDQLESEAERTGLAQYIEVIEADIGRLDWPAGCLDLLWSEGAAYNLGFATALETWRPLLASGGIAVISEMNYFTPEVSEELRSYLQTVYPGIMTEAENIALIASSGFEVLAAEPLPARAWWENYYDPLRQKIDNLEVPAGSIMQTVIDDTLQEMAMFRRHQQQYGYSFFLLRAV